MDLLESDAQLLPESRLGKTLRDAEYTEVFGNMVVDRTLFFRHELGPHTKLYACGNFIPPIPDNVLTRQDFFLIGGVLFL